MKFNCVRIDWVDSSGVNEWHSPSTEDKVAVCVTVGIIKSENKEQITVKQSHDFTLEHIDNTITIPKCSVKAIKRFKV
jgi:hypothetical protein